MKQFGTPTHPQDLVTLKYLQDNIIKMIGGGIVVPKNVKLNNLITNGDFSQGETNWNVHFKDEGNSFTRSAKLIQNPDGWQALYQDLPFNIKKGDIIYASSIINNYSGIEVTLNNNTFSNLMKHNTTDSNVPIGYSGYYSKILVSNGGLRRFGFLFTGGKGEIVFDNFMAINLTQSFGAGNEPTKEQMDKLINHLGYFEGEKEVNYYEIL